MPLIGLPWSDAQLFNAINVVLPGWAALMLLPRQAKLCSALVNFAALSMCLLYTLLIVSAAQQAPLPLADMMTYEGVASMLKQPGVALPAWVHYAAFDLFVGHWITQDAVRRNVPQLLLIPVLLATMFLGPAGLLLHFVVLRPIFRIPAAKAKSKAA